MINEVDIDGNGEVDFEEFKEVMTKILEKPTIPPLEKGGLLGEDGLPKISDSALSDDLFDPAGEL